MDGSNTASSFSFLDDSIPLVHYLLYSASSILAERNTERLGQMHYDLATV